MLNYLKMKTLKKYLLKYLKKWIVKKPHDYIIRKCHGNFSHLKYIFNLFDKDSCKREHIIEQQYIRYKSKKPYGQWP